MYLRQTDLFWGLNQNVVNRLMGIAKQEVFAEGDVLFRSDDAARHLFILAQGEVKIAMDESGAKVYTGSRVGEAFGWGSLIDRSTYGGSAICATPTSSSLARSSPTTSHENSTCSIPQPPNHSPVPKVKFR